VKHYLRVASVLIPRREEMLHTIVKILPFSEDKELLIMDLGAGFGVLTEELLDRFPKAKIVWVDVSEEMLKAAKERLRRFEGSVSFYLRDFEDEEWVNGLGQRFDAVVSSLSLHHASDDDKKRIFGDIYRILKCGGCFINGDRVRAPSGWLDDYYMREWAEFMVVQMKRFFKEEKTVEEVIATQRRMETEYGDKPATLENNMRWLHEAGFDIVDCVWKYNNRAIIIAYKPP
jgi:tRNA (cmo5U34)-methyltransferase